MFKIITLAIVTLLPGFVFAADNPASDTCSELQHNIQLLDDIGKLRPKQTNKAAINANNDITDYIGQSRSTLTAALDAAQNCEDANRVERALQHLSWAAYWLHYDTHVPSDAQTMLRATTDYLAVAKEIIQHQPEVLTPAFYHSDFRQNLDTVYKYRTIALQALGQPTAVTAILAEQAQMGFCAAQWRLAENYTRAQQNQLAAQTYQTMLHNPACRSSDSTNHDFAMPGLRLVYLYEKMGQPENSAAALQKQFAINQAMTKQIGCGSAAPPGEFETIYRLAAIQAKNKPEQAFELSQYGLARATVSSEFADSKRQAVDEVAQPSWQKLKNIWSRWTHKAEPGAGYAHEYLPKLNKLKQNLAAKLPLETQTRLTIQATVKALNSCADGLTDPQWLQQYDPDYQPFIPVPEE